MTKLSNPKNKVLLVEVNPQVDDALNRLVAYRQRLTPERPVSRAEVVRSVIWQAAEEAPRDAIRRALGENVDGMNMTQLARELRKWGFDFEGPEASRIARSMSDVAFDPKRGFVLRTEEEE